MDEFVDSSDLLGNDAALRARAAADGTLFFRGLLPADAIFDLRHRILEICAEAGWLKPGADLDDGIAAPGVIHVEGEPEYMAVYDRVTRLEAFHRLAHHPRLLAMFDALFGEPTLAHARNIARIIFPNAAQHTTPAHQDYLHIQGSVETWTSWIPLGDCPQALGSLAVLPGSHRDGLFPVQQSLGAGGFGIDTSEMPLRWAASDFKAGDVLVFQSMLVHKGLPNRTPDRLRLSVDFRYQGVSQPIVASSLEPHFGRLSWDEIYAGWSSDEYRYYWKRADLNVVDPENLYGRLSM